MASTVFAMSMEKKIIDNSTAIEKVREDLSNLNEVEFAHQIVTDDAQQSTGEFLFRTTGGDASLSDGEAKLNRIFGKSVHIGKVNESIRMTITLGPREPIPPVDPDDEPVIPEDITAVLDRNTFVSVMQASGTIVFSYTTAWDVDPSTYGITVSGDPVDGDAITVVYVKAEFGTITSSDPTSFISTGWNLYNHTSGYARVKKYSNTYGFIVGGTYTALQFSETLAGEKETITITDGHFTIPSDGYVWVTGGDDTTTYILMTWSDWTSGYEGDWQAYTETEIDFSDVMEDFPNGLMSLGSVADEIDFNMHRAISRIEKLANTAANMEAIIASGRKYDYDANYIYAVRSQEVTYSFELDNDYYASDHGLEIIIGGSIEVLVETLYGRNLVDYLRHDVPGKLEELQNSLKVGEIKIFSGSTIPSKWKVCDGSVISRTTYNRLFGAIGTDWGGGDGETTFAIPDFQGRTPIGVGENEATGHTAHTLGQMEGEEKHVLSVAELANHNHGNNTFNTGASSTSAYGNYPFQLKADYKPNFTSIGTHYTGSNTPHNTMQPYAACNIIIYTGVEEESA